MTMGQVDLVELALRHILALDGAASSNEQKMTSKHLSKIRSRAREIPSLIMESGLVPGLLFYLSKTGAYEYKYAARTLSCISGESSVEQSTDMNKEKLDDGKFSYAVVSAAIICSLVQLGYLDKMPQDIHEAIGSLLDLRNSSEGVREIEALASIEQYLISLKRAAESLWEEEG